MSALAACSCQAATGAQDPSASLKHLQQKHTFQPMAVLLQAELSASYFATFLTEMMVTSPRCQGELHCPALYVLVTSSRASIAGRLT